VARTVAKCVELSRLRLRAGGRRVGAGWADGHARGPCRNARAASVGRRVADQFCLAPPAEAAARSGQAAAGACWRRGVRFRFLAARLWVDSAFLQESKTGGASEAEERTRQSTPRFRARCQADQSSRRLVRQ